MALTIQQIFLGRQKVTNSVQPLFSVIKYPERWGCSASDYTRGRNCSPKTIKPFRYLPSRDILFPSMSKSPPAIAVGAFPNFTSSSSSSSLSLALRLLVGYLFPWFLIIVVIKILETFLYKRYVGPAGFRKAHVELWTRQTSRRLGVL